MVVHCNNMFDGHGGRDKAAASDGDEQRNPRNPWGRLTTCFCFCRYSRGNESSHGDEEEKYTGSEHHVGGLVLNFIAIVFVSLFSFCFFLFAFASFLFYGLNWYINTQSNDGMFSWYFIRLSRIFLLKQTSMRKLYQDICKSACF